MARHGQRGSTAIEFALLFIPVFALFYAIVSSGIVFMLLEGFNSAAEGGARAAIAVDPAAYPDTQSFLDDGVTPVVREQVALQLAWLPAHVREEVLGDDWQHIEVSYQDNVLTVVVGYRNYNDQPMIPLLYLPGIGVVPKVPDRLVSIATSRL